MTVIIPMAGSGRRFKQAGFLIDKPFILVNGRPMIETVVNNLDLKDEHHIFIVRKEQYEKYGLDYYLPSLVKSCDIVQVEKLTEGAACTVAMAEPFVKDERVVVANSDQFVDYPLKHFFKFSNDYDGAILTFRADHPKWSYVRLVDPPKAKGFQDIIVPKHDYIKYCRVVEVAEKQVISNRATVGIYTFRNPSLLFNSIRQMIKDNVRTNNEFYLCPIYNYLIDDYMIVEYNIPAKDVWGIGQPNDLDIFLKRFENEKKNLD